jgi:predicted dithiol-disulfide oxidoreductase (DUF899 family)
MKPEKTKTNTAKTSFNRPGIVSEPAWLAARKQLLKKEKEFTRQRDALSAERRKLPWVKVAKEYIFDGPKGKESLADLFDGRSQLIVYHFMFGPEWKEGCPSCSFLADHIDGTLAHLEHHDVTLLVISRAQLPNIEVYKKRMGWRFKWVSSFGIDFNFDYHVSFTRPKWRRETSAITTKCRRAMMSFLAPASSTKTSPATSSIPIPVTRAAVTSCSVPTTTLTSRRRAATKPAHTTIRPTGCGVTTSTAKEIKNNLKSLSLT